MSHTEQDAFFRVARTRHQTSAGDVELPILYYDSTQAQAYFLCDLDRVERSLEGTGLRPGLVVGRRAVVGLVFFEYRRTSIGAYNEVGLALPVVEDSIAASASTWRDLFRRVDDPKRKLAFHVLHLPVTTPQANAAGRELWGLPKFVTDIPFAFSAQRFDGAVLDPKDRSPICRLSGTPGLRLPATTLDLLLFSQLDGRDLHTTIQTRGHTRGYGGGSVRLEVGTSSHPMAATLRTLGLEKARPLLLSLTPDFQSRLNAGVAHLRPGASTVRPPSAAPRPRARAAG